jgi:hypothetical protein
MHARTNVAGRLVGHHGEFRLQNRDTAEVAVVIALAEIDSLGSSLLEEPLEILTPETESAAVPELGSRDDALSCPVPQRLDMNL